MLEYALVQERAKFHRLKYGCDPPTMSDIKPPSDEQDIANDVAPDSEVAFSSVSPTTWRQGRQLLRQYLQEIGYNDTIIDVRSNRVRSLLGLNNNAEQEENVSPNINGNENKRNAAFRGRSTPAKESQQAMAEAMILDSEAAVMANFEFLGPADVEISDEDGISDDLDLIGSEDNMKTAKRKGKIDIFFCCNNEKLELIVYYFLFSNYDKDIDAEAEEVLNELNSLTAVEDANLITSPKNQSKISNYIKMLFVNFLMNAFQFFFLVTRRFSEFGIAAITWYRSR